MYVKKIINVVGNSKKVL